MSKYINTLPLSLYSLSTKLPGNSLWTPLLSLHLTSSSFLSSSTHLLLPSPLTYFISLFFLPSLTIIMKLTKYIPKKLFKYKNTRSISRSDDPSFGSLGSESSSDTEFKNKPKGLYTPTSVLQPTLSAEISADDEWSEVSPDVYAELLHAFHMMDTDGDGKIRKEELEAILTRVGGNEPPSKEELNLLLNEVDKDGDGCISLEEFGAISSAFAPPSCDGELRDAFDFFDADHDGKITAEELFNVFRTIGGRCTLEDCRRMIRGVDKNGDGFVCFEDFCLMMELQR